MGTFFKKDLLIFIRDRKELLIILLMPFVLIVILGFALKGLMDDGIGTLEMKIALVSKDDEAAGLEMFQRDLAAADFSPEERMGISSMIEDLKPYQVLQQMLGSEELGELLETVEMDTESAQEALKREEVVAILSVPELFTYDALKRMLLKEGDGSTLSITVGDHSPLLAQVFEEIISGFARTLNYDTALGQAIGLEAFATQQADQFIGGRESVNQLEPLSSIQYYTLSMTVMFVLFVASTTAGKAYVEKHQHSFDRVLLAGVLPLSYLSGKIASAACIVICQTGILFALSHLIFRSFANKPFTFWLAVSGIVLTLSLCVGAISSLLTALNFRFNSYTAGAFFGNVLVAIMAFIGGSFMPVASLPEWFGRLSQWTPNGLALSAFLQGFQGAGWDILSTPLLKLLIVSIVLIMISIVIFPKRRAS